MSTKKVQGVQKLFLKKKFSIESNFSFRNIKISSPLEKGEVIITNFLKKYVHSRYILFFGRMLLFQFLRSTPSCEGYQSITNINNLFPKLGTTHLLEGE